MPAWLDVLCWAAYLACSWTWCIGMFLPVLLIRDYGIMGWVVFAVPNVLGAAAMGWVLRDSTSERIVRAHGPAIETFRVVTVVFQLWFVMAYLAPPIGGGLAGASDNRGVILVVLAIGLLLGLRYRLGVLAWFLSIACAAFVLARGGISVPAAQLASHPGVLWLAPVCAFGFALCPYLDPTFHQARQSLSAGRAGAAFALGFGVLFLAMIAFTLQYAEWALAALGGRANLSSIIALAIAAHIALQLMYTCTVHARSRIGRGPWPPARIAFVMLLAAAVAWGTWLIPDRLAASTGMEAREAVYRCFMAFYGLVFPAYVWLCMVSGRPYAGTSDGAGIPPAVFADDGHHAPSPRTLRVFFLTVGIAAPFFWMGFIEREEIWLAPGLGIVLLARMFVATGRSSTSGPPR